MSPRMVILANIAAALLATIVVMGPLLAMLWFSWRGIVAAALIMAAMGVGFLTWWMTRCSDRFPRRYANLL